MRWYIHIALFSVILAVAPRLVLGEVRVERIDGDPLKGRELSLNDNTLRVAPTAQSDQPAMIPREELISLEFPPGPSAPSRPNGLLEFANGDRLAAEIIATDGDHLRARLWGRELRVPLGRLRSLVWTDARIDRDARRLMFREEGADDLLLMTNGDRTAGRFVGIGEQDVTLAVSERTLTIPKERIAAIAFSPELISIPDTPKQRQIVHGPAGWITLTELRGSTDGQFTGRTRFDTRLSLPTDEIERIQFFGPRVVPLTDLEPASVDFTPWLTRQWPIQTNRTVRLRPLALGDRRYAIGIGVHSQTRLTYSLSREYESLSVAVGLANSAGNRGRANVSILTDGQMRRQRADLTRAAGPVTFENISLRETESLSLIVDYGGNGDIRDRVNWCDPILIRPATTEAPPKP